MTIHRIGIIGGSIGSFWAAHSHIPAIAALPNIRLSAVSTTNIDSARASAAAFGADHAFANAVDLAECPDVDLVVVSVKSYDHVAVTEAVIPVGKPVFLEWPMGPGGEATQRLAELARERAIPTIVGLQGRFAPPVEYARKLIDDGYVGKLLSANIYAEYGFWNETIVAGYGADEQANAHVLIIPGGHALDVLTFIAGDVAEIDGTLSYQRQDGFALDKQAIIKMTAPDQFAAQGTLLSGAVFSTHILGSAPMSQVLDGKLTGNPFRLSLVGTEGQLVLETDGMPEIAPLTLNGSRGKLRPEPIAIPAAFGAIPAGLPDPAIAVARLYARLPEKLTDIGGDIPNFEHGLKIHRLLDAIKLSARTGRRQRLLSPSSKNGAA